MAPRFEHPLLGRRLRQMRQRKTQEMYIDAPIGGWNTRDAVDNLPPTDAVILDNWIPDFGSVKIRPGYDEHSSSINIVTGGELALNPGFETAGGGGADVFANWDETVNSPDDTLFQSSSFKHAGSYSCHFHSMHVYSSHVDQTITVTADTTYTLSFYSATSDVLCRTGFFIYDASNTEIIQPSTAVWHNDVNTWMQTTHQFTTPAGCTSIEIWLYGSGYDGRYVDVYYDTVSLKVSHPASNVESLMVYRGAATEKMLAADGGIIWDATSITPSQLATGFNSDRWQHANMDNKMGMVNGHASDAPQEYNGSAVSAMTLTGSGLTANNVIGINVFKARSYFWEDNSQDFWYSAIDALGGALTKFPLSRVGNWGGTLISMQTWTHDGGSGPDDYAVFFMSSGEAIVYQGYSPAAGSNWALVGIYQIGDPLSIRGFTKFGGDIIIMTTLDFVRLSEVIRGEEQYTPGHKAIGAVRDAITTYGSNWGWQPVVFPRRNLIMFNIPVEVNATYRQFVLNMSTGAWCRFTGWNSDTWAVFQDRLYFGTLNGVVAEAFSGNDDDGSAVNTDLQTAWLPMGRKVNKVFVGVEHVYKMGTKLAENSDFAVDYETHGIVNVPAANDPTGTPWGSPWGSPWSSAPIVQRIRKLIRGFGRVISMRQRTATKDSAEWFGSTWLFRTSRRSF